MNKKWTIHLSLEELEKLEAIVRKGKSSARTIRRAHSLLLAHEGREDKEIAASLKCVESSIYWTRRRLFRVNYLFRSTTIIFAGFVPLRDGWVNSNHHCLVT